MTESWVPKEGDELEVLSNGYGKHDQRPLVGMTGKVLKVDTYEGRRIIVIQFVRKENSKFAKKALDKLFVGWDDKALDSFKEYFDVSRQPYLYFKPTTETILGK